MVRDASSILLFPLVSLFLPSHILDLDMYNTDILFGVRDDDNDTGGSLEEMYTALAVLDCEGQIHLYLQAQSQDLKSLKLAPFENTTAFFDCVVLLSNTDWSLRGCFTLVTHGKAQRGFSMIKCQIKAKGMGKGGRGAIGIDAELVDTPGLAQYHQEHGEVEFAELRATIIGDAEISRWRICGITESRAHCHIFEAATKGIT